MNGRRKKVVIIAPGCDGTDVGEAQSSFQWVSRLAKDYDLTVLSYRKRNRPTLVGQIPDAEIVEWLDMPLSGRWERFNSIAKPGYIPFYFRARHWLKDELRNGRHIDLIHQLAPLALRYPSPAAGHKIPYIVGPLGGSLSTPEAFSGEMGSVPGYMYLRGLDLFRLKFDPMLRGTYRDADIVIGVAPYVREMLHTVGIKRFELLSETGVTELPAISEKDSRDPVCKLLYVGRLTRMKGVRDAIRALKELPESCRVVFNIVGDGEDRGACEEEVRRYGLENKVFFHGRVARQEVDEFYRSADIFVFPSLREPSGNVVLEAMSFGLPLIVADRGGPGYVVEDSFGIRVPVTTPQEYAKGLATAIVKLVEKRDQFAHMGDSSRAEILRRHIWSSKIESLTEMYNSLFSASGHLSASGE